MKKAIFLYGPSGSGKTTLTKQIISKYDFKHCDTDYFMFAFSPKRSKIRSEIAVEVSYTFAKELIKRDYNLIIEAITPKKVNNLKRLLREKKYQIIDISLTSTLEKCLKNNKTRDERCFSDSAIKQSFRKHSLRKGFIIDVSNLTSSEVFKKIEKKFLK